MISFIQVDVRNFKDLQINIFFSKKKKKKEIKERGSSNFFMLWKSTSRTKIKINLSWDILL